MSVLPPTSLLPDQTRVCHSLEAFAIFWTVLDRTTVLPPTSSLLDL
uniref:Uncharacterized protein n=1 Tax=Cucumis melo TaxID=3656 RepID=A0A9I9CDB8_CUCME